MTLFFPNALKSYFWSKRYLELRYRAEILTHLSKALGYVFFLDIRFLKSTMDAEKSIPMKHTKKMKYLLNITIFTCFMSRSQSTRSPSGTSRATS